jgi:hypothetical protein
MNIKTTVADIIVEQLAAMSNEAKEKCHSERSSEGSVWRRVSN